MSQSPPLPRIPGTTAAHRRTDSLPEAGLTPLRTTYFTKEYAEVSGWRGTQRSGAVLPREIGPTVTRPHATKSLREMNQLPRYPHSRVHSMLSTALLPNRHLSSQASTPRLQSLSPKQLHLDVEVPPQADFAYQQQAIHTPPHLQAARHSHSRSDIKDEVLKIPSQNLPPSPDTRTRETSARRLSRSAFSDSVDSLDPWENSLPFHIPGSGLSPKADMLPVQEIQFFSRSMKPQIAPACDFLPFPEVHPSEHSVPSTPPQSLLPQPQTVIAEQPREPRELTNRQVVFRDLFPGRKVERSLSFTSTNGHGTGKSLFDTFLRGLIKGVIVDKTQAAEFIETELKDSHLTPLKTQSRRKSIETDIRPKFLLQIIQPSPDTKPSTPPSVTALVSPRAQTSTQFAQDSSSQTNHIAAEAKVDTAPSNPIKKQRLEVELKPVFTDLVSVATEVPVEEGQRPASILTHVEQAMTGRSAAGSMASSIESEEERSRDVQQKRKHTRTQTRPQRRSSSQWTADHQELTEKLSPLLSQPVVPLITIQAVEAPPASSKVSESSSSSQQLKPDTVKKTQQRRSLMTVQKRNSAVDKLPRRKSMQPNGTAKATARRSSAVARKPTEIPSEGPPADALKSPRSEKPQESPQPVITLESPQPTERQENPDVSTRLENTQPAILESTALKKTDNLTLPATSPRKVLPPRRNSSIQLFESQQKGPSLRRSSVSSVLQESIKTQQSGDEVAATIDLQLPDPLEEFIFQFAQSLLVSLRVMAVPTGEDTPEVQQEEKMKIIRETKARRSSLHSPVASVVHAGISRTFSEHLMNLQGIKEAPVGQKAIQQGGRLLIPPAAQQGATASPRTSGNETRTPARSSRGSFLKPAPVERRRSSIFIQERKPTRKKRSEDSSGSEEADWQEDAGPNLSFIGQSAEFELKHMAMVKKLAEGIMVGRKPVSHGGRKVRFFNIALDESEQRQKELEDKVSELEEEETPVRPAPENFEVLWQKEAEENDLREDVSEMLQHIMQGKSSTVRDFAFSSKVNYDFQSIEEMRKERAYRELEMTENPDEEGMKSALMRERFLALCEAQPKQEDLIREQRKVLHMSDSTVLTKDEQLQEFRRQLQKRIFREKVARGRAGQEIVRLRAKPVTTFTNLPVETAPPKKRFRSSNSERLLLDGKAKTVNDSLHLRERVYLRLKGDTNLSKFERGRKAHGAMSLSSSVRMLSAMHSRPGTVI